MFNLLKQKGMVGENKKVTNELVNSKTKTVSMAYPLKTGKYLQIPQSARRMGRWRGGAATGGGRAAAAFPRPLSPLPAHTGGRP